MYVLASIRRGVTPEINVIAAVILAVTLSVLAAAWILYRRQAAQGRRTAAEAA